MAPSAKGSLPEEGQHKLSAEHLQLLVKELKGEVGGAHGICHIASAVSVSKNQYPGNSMAAQWLGLCTFTAKGVIRSLIQN